MTDASPSPSTLEPRQPHLNVLVDGLIITAQMPVGDWIALLDHPLHRESSKRFQSEHWRFARQAKGAVRHHLQHVVAAVFEGVQIDRNDAWVDFPQSVDFHLLATTAEAIDSVYIEYGVKALTCGDVTTVAAPDFEPGPDLDVTWRWEVASSGVIPPGTEIWWRWRLVVDGEEIVTSTQMVSIDDAWFVWESLTDRQCASSVASRSRPTAMSPTGRPVSRTQYRRSAAPWTSASAPSRSSCS